MNKFKKGLEILQKENPFTIIISDKTIRRLKNAEVMNKIAKIFRRKRK